MLNNRSSVSTGPIPKIDHHKKPIFKVGDRIRVVGPDPRRTGPDCRNGEVFMGPVVRDYAGGTYEWIYVVRRDCTNCHPALSEVLENELQVAGPGTGNNSQPF